MHLCCEGIHRLLLATHRHIRQALLLPAGERLVAKPRDTGLTHCSSVSLENRSGLLAGALAQLGECLERETPLGVHLQKRTGHPRWQGTYPLELDFLAGTHQFPVSLLGLAVRRTRCIARVGGALFEQT
jgi:hypothetical protein